MNMFSDFVGGDPPDDIAFLAVRVTDEQAMVYSIEMKIINPQPIIAVKRQTTMPDLVVSLKAGLAEIWERIRTDDIKHAGRNVVVYSPGINDIVDMEMGVEILSPSGIPDNELSETPSGSSACTIHTGAYDGIPQAHQAIRSWCSKQKVDIIGPNWEIYGHWNEDTSKLTTEVYYLIAL